MAQDNLRFVGVEAAVEEFEHRFGNKENISPSLIMKTADDVARKLGRKSQLVKKIQLLYVRDYEVELPKDFAMVIQMAYRNEKDKKKVRATDLVNWTQKGYGNGCDINVSVDCEDCYDGPSVVIDADRIEELKNPIYFQNQKEFLYKWGNVGRDRLPSSFLNSEFKMLKPAQNNFFNADYYIPGCLNLSNKLESKELVEYAIKYPKIIVDTEECEILLSYFAENLDENGYRKIPDDPYVLDAIIWKVQQMALYKKFTETGNTVFENSSDRAYDRYRNAFRLASSKLDKFTYDTWYSFMRTHWTQVLPDLESRKRYDRTRTGGYSPPYV